MIVLRVFCLWCGRETIGQQEQDVFLSFLGRTPVVDECGMKEAPDQHFFWADYKMAVVDRYNELGQRMDIKDNIQ